MSTFNEAGVCRIVQNVIDTADLTANSDPIANTDVSTDTVYLAAAVNILTTDRKSFLCLQTLPDPSAENIPNGHVAYLCDAKTMIVASNGSWIGLDGRSIGEKIENRLYTWGQGQCGMLGIGLVISACSPVREFCFATDWCLGTIRNAHATAIKTDGSLWAWGRNGSGALGDGTTVNRCSPVREFCSATDWCQLSDHDEFSNAAIKTDGSLWSWGINTCGVLGDGTITTRCSPVREICSANNWFRVTGGILLTHAIKDDGSLWGWGCNQCGGTGDGKTTSVCSPVREFCSATNWCKVSSLGNGAVALKTSGELWSWGSNQCGHLGVGTISNSCSPIREICSATDWCTVSSAPCTILAIKTNGTLWGWGLNNSYSIGDGTTISRCSPIREICSATNWCLAASGCRSALALKTDGSLWSWGINTCGALGDGTITTRCSPVREFFSAADWIYADLNKNGDSNLGITATKVICR